ncbi:hypothetical protein P879_08386 [Paragonimus westermani]|uniref:Uncharacterized protein n=1 Tax=Paragonimus westermani TaxID=34504 RepID=A0A8T0DKU2_9TREM|nr:hypothetical protein P879_08386 [Paragonimus westermani]
MWTTKDAMNVLQNYTNDFINNILATELVPQVILETIQMIQKDVTAGKSLKQKETKVNQWKREKNKLLVELERVLQSKELQQSSSSAPLFIPAHAPLKLAKPVRQVQEASFVIANAIAFDIYDVLVNELLHFYVPQTVQSTLIEAQLFHYVLEKTTGGLMREIAKHQLERSETRARQKRLACIQKHATDRPGDVLGSVALELLLPWVGSQSLETLVKSKAEECIIEALALDLLLQRLVAIDENMAATVKCRPLATFHAAANVDLFFREAIHTLNEHIDQDLEDIDLAEICDRISDKSETCTIGELLPRDSKWNILE